MRTSRCILYTALGTVLSLFYVFQQTEIVKLGYKITAAEKELSVNLDKKTSLQFMLSSLESPLSIDKNLFSNKNGFEMAQRYLLVRVGPDVKSTGGLTGVVGPARPSGLARFASLLGSRPAEAKTVK